jgi:hypothetical protein
MINTDDFKSLIKQPSTCQVVKSGHYQSFRQVAPRTEDDQNTGRRWLCAGG